MLAHSPDARFATPAEVADVLRPFCNGHALEELVESPAELLTGGCDVGGTVGLLNREISTSRVVTSSHIDRVFNASSVERPRDNSRSWKAAVTLTVLGLLVSIGIAAFALRPKKRDAIVENTGGSEGTAPPNPFAANIAAIPNLPSVAPPKIDVAVPTWDAGPGEDTLPGGLLPRPALFLGIERWQLYSKSPRFSFIHDGRQTWSPNGKWMTIREDACCKVYDVATGDVTAIGPAGWCYWSHDSQWIATIHHPNATFMRPDGSGRYSNGTGGGWRVGWSPVENRYAVLGSHLVLISPETRSAIP